MEIKLAYLFPDLLNLYGDRGNIITLKKRLEDRGITANVKEYSLEDEVDFKEIDILYIGGGSERSEELALKRLKELKDGIKEYAEDGGVVLAVCSGYEMLGKYIKKKDKKEALGILDIYTEYGKKRMIGDLVLQSDAFGNVAGFENRYGKVNTGSLAPLGTVIHSTSGRKDTEGVVYKNVIATHLHGPILPKNPGLADHLIKCALEKKYGKAELKELDDTLEIKANEYIVNMLNN